LFHTYVCHHFFIALKKEAQDRKRGAVLTV